MIENPKSNDAITTEDKEPCWIPVENMTKQPRGWYWSDFPETWVFYSPERNAALCIDYGDLKWNTLLASNYWGPWKKPIGSPQYNL